MGKYKRYVQTSIVLVLIITLALAIGPTIRTLAAETIFRIQNAELTSISDGAEGTIASFDESNIISNVVFHHLNDSATYKITLKNSDSKDHIIETITDDNENSYISYNYNKHENELINAGNDLVFDLTATYSTANTDTSARIQSTNVKFYIQFVDVEEPVEIDLDVPNTGANATGAKSAAAKDQDLAKAVLPIVIAASTGLIIVAIIAIKKHKKFAKVTAALVIAGTAVAIAANVRAVVTEINSFTIATEYGLYDKLVIHNGDEDIIIDYGTPLEDIDEITDPIKTGYTFDGWTDEDENDVDPTNPITKDTTIAPKFTAITYTIKFHGNGAPVDQQMPDQVLTYDEAQNLTVNTFSWKGRTYTGWDTTTAGNGTFYENGQEVKNLTTTNNDIIDLYAQWSINPYHIAYDANGGEGEMAQTNCEYDQDCQLRQNTFTKYGYDFKGWAFDNNNYDDEATVRNLATSGTITMVAKWEAHEYEIHYSGLTTEEEEYLRSEGNPDTYTIESQSYTLKKPLDRKDADGDVRQHCIGWRDITVFEDITLPITNSLGDKYYEAVWTDVELDRFQITYDYDGGNVATANPTTHNKEESFTLNNPTKTGYIFTGWTGTTIEGDTPVRDYTLPNPHVATNINFVAHYTPIQYSIVFAKGADNATGNTASMSMKYDEAKNLTVNGFERTGYTFAGWKDTDGNDYNDGAEVINLTTTDEDTITLTAQWTPNSFVVVYYPNSSEVTNQYAMLPQNVTYDTQAALNANAYERPHYKFMGWATSATGDKVYDDQADITNALSEDGGILNLHAVWLERTAHLKPSSGSTGISSVAFRTFAGLGSATAFIPYEGVPDFDNIENEIDIAKNDSNFPVYVWGDGETVYWWSEAETIYMNPDSASFFAQATKLQTIDITGFNSSLVTNLSNFFDGDAALVSVDLTPLKDAHPTSTNSMFKGNKNLASVDLSPINNSANTDMGEMFNGATSLTTVNLSVLDTSNVKYMNKLFNGCTNFESVDFSQNNLSSLETMASMFNGDKKLQNINFTGVNTPNLLNMSEMFRGAKIASLDLSDLDTQNVTTLGVMFYYADIAELDISGWDTSSLTTIGSMFAAFNGHGMVLDLSSWNTENLSGSMYEVFYGANVSVLDLSSFNIDANRAANMSMTTLFNFSNVIETVYATENLHLNPTSNLGIPADYGGQSHLVGGAGTTLRDVVGATEVERSQYARIDDPDNGKPGLFTIKDSIYVRYHDNDGDDTNDEANYALMPSHYVTTDSENPYTLATKLTKNSFERDGYIFLGWATSAENAAEGTIAYVDEATISGLEASKTPYELYAVWRVENTKFIVGAVNNANPSLNKVFKGYETDEKKVRSIQRSATAPNLDEIDETIISTADSDYEIYAWFNDETETVYWYTQSKKPLMNSPAGAFAGLAYVTSIDISTADTGAAESMESMFSGDKLLTSVNYGDNFVTDQVKNMASMFNSTGFTELDLTSWNVENVTTTSGMFYEMQSLATINLSNWNTKSLKNIYRMFYNDKILSTESLNASVRNWNVENLEEAGGAFENLKSITILDLSNWHTTEKLTSMDYMFRFNNLLEVVDISNFNTSNVARVYSLTQSLLALRTIYVGEAEPFKNATGQGWSFNGTTNIVGGNGTTYSNGPTGNENWRQAYRVDDPAHGAPGFLTYKNPLVVTFDAGEGTASRESYNYIPSTDYGTLPTVSNIPEGKVFEGWYTAAEGGEKVNDNDAFVSSETHTLYARFSLRFMQDMTIDTLDALIPNNGDTITLYDNRDNKAYTVGRLADGNVWLLENLRLDPTEVSLDTLKGNTNASDASLEYLKGVRTGTADDQYAVAAVSSAWPTDADNYAKPFVNTSRADTVISDGYEGKVGVYYNYCAATAGSYCYGDGSDVSNATSAPEAAYGAAVGDAWEDICPAGWRLPTASDTGEYKALYGSYSEHSDLKNAFRSTFSSAVREGALIGNPEAYYWASNQGGTSGVMASSAIFNTNAWNYSYIGRQYGLSVRCIFNKNYMQSTPESLLGFLMPNDGDTTTLYDKRDGKAYEVANINGTYWMASNLDLAGGTVLTSALSNVETDYTLPNSSIDGFKPASYTGVYNSNNTECAEGTPCYSYYDYNVATAGTDPASGDATSDICPKGWRLPTMDEYISLINAYPTGDAITASPFAMQHAGYFEEGGGTFWHGNLHGYIWSSTAYVSDSRPYAKYLSVQNNDAAINKYTYSYKTNGYSVRCVAKAAAPQNVTVTFHGNNDDTTGNMDPQTTTSGSNLQLADNGFALAKNHFRGWNTQEDGQGEHYGDGDTINNLTENLDLYAEWKNGCESFATDPWSLVASDFTSDPAFFDPVETCERTIEMDVDDNGENEEYRLRLINTTTPEECLTAGFSQTACGVVVEFVNTIGTKKWKESGKPKQGWYGSDLITYLNGTIYNKLPADLQSVIIPTYIVSGYSVDKNKTTGEITPNESPDITLEDTDKNKIYLHSTKELGFDFSLDNKREYMRTNDFYQVEENRKAERVLTGSTSASRRFWSRSMADLSLAENPPFNTDTFGWKAIYLLKNDDGTNTASYGVDTDTGKYDIIPVFRIGVNN